jgi:hypothetical protein
MTTDRTRCDRIIALIDACLAEFGSPSQPTPARVAANDLSTRRHHR